ncbi:MAG: phytase [Planctomycetes bacterium]|nr:phytase [Planctomycetota bacterium]
MSFAPLARRAAVSLLLFTDAANAQQRPPVELVHPEPRAETAPVASADDAADDPALWLHPTEPARSLILGTDKKDGLYVYALDGRQLAHVGAGLAPNNVDLRYGFAMGAQVFDLAVCTVRGRERGLAVWLLDAATGLPEPEPRVVHPLFLDDEPYGVALWKRPSDGAFFAFASDKRGRVAQFALRATREASQIAITVEEVRRFEVGSQVEGLVVDDEHGWLFVAEETGGLWRYDAQPFHAATHADRVELLARGAFTPDLEGLALLCDGAGGGYLLVSLQGENRYALFERVAPHRLVREIDPVASRAIDDVEETDGLDATAWPLPPLFPHGIVVVQDGENPGATQNFKLFGWEQFGGSLPFGSAPSPREARWRRALVRC